MGISFTWPFVEGIFVPFLLSFTEVVYVGYMRHHCLFHECFLTNWVTVFMFELLPSVGIFCCKIIKMIFSIGNLKGSCNIFFLWGYSGHCTCHVTYTWRMYAVFLLCYFVDEEHANCLSYLFKCMDFYTSHCNFYKICIKWPLFNLFKNGLYVFIFIFALIFGILNS